MDENQLKMARLITYENIAVAVCTTVLVLGLFWMSNSFYSLWGLLLATIMVKSVEVRKNKVYETKEGTE